MEREENEDYIEYNKREKEIRSKLELNLDRAGCIAGVVGLGLIGLVQGTTYGLAQAMDYFDIWSSYLSNPTKENSDNLSGVSMILITFDLAASYISSLIGTTIVMSIGDSIAYAKYKKEEIKARRKLYRNE